MTIQPTLRHAVAALAVLIPVACAHADNLSFKAALNGANEVPPKSVAGTGGVDATFNTETRVFHYHVSYDGLTAAATAAHFHGPATPGVNAGVAVGLKGSLTSPIDGEATLTPEQATDLIAGKWYFNIHTPANPGGELRGQLAQVK